MTRTKDGVGGYGERTAPAHLLEEGAVLLDPDRRCRTGEIDIEHLLRPAS
jgi:Holliday junction resolvase-like predicted endonuclease